MLSNNLPFENPCITFEPITHKVARISPGPLKGNHPKVWKSYRSYPQNPCIENNFCHNSNAKGNVGKGSPVTPHSPSTESDSWANGFIGPPKMEQIVNIHLLINHPGKDSEFWRTLSRLYEPDFRTRKWRMA